ncbi:MAG: riboflavin biosynthesis protein RibF [Lachnospiraceae bacterium]|nr:riboflavin biosynthesis protein RibF [Lachnospiraceae bacterium]
MNLWEHTAAFRTEPSSVMLGKFDGIHRGHQGLLRCMEEDGLPYRKGLLTFDFSVAAAGFSDAEQLFVGKEREQIAGAYGFDWMVRLPFTDAVRTMPPEAFFEEYLLKRCQARAIYVGEDYRFGYRRQGDAKLLAGLCETRGVRFRAIPEIRYGEEKISSSRLRAKLAAGDLSETRAMLGYPYFVTGTVVHGKKIGRTIEFPTANLSWGNGKLLPPIGVYDTYSLVEGIGYFGITNVGNNPTVRGEGKNALTVETHLLDFSKEIYGERMTTFFLEKTREQQAFPGLDALRTQLAHDKERLYRVRGRYDLADVERFA